MNLREAYTLSLEQENKDLKEQLKVKESEIDEFRKLAMNLGNKVMKDENISETEIANNLIEIDKKLHNK